MISRGEVGLIVPSMGATSGIFGKSEVAVMVAVVLLTTLITPIALRSAFNLKSEEYFEDAPQLEMASTATPEIPLPTAEEEAKRADLSKGASFRTDLNRTETLLSFPQGEVASD